MGREGAERDRDPYPDGPGVYGRCSSPLLRPLQAQQLHAHGRQERRLRQEDVVIRAGSFPCSGALQRLVWAAHYTHVAAHMLLHTAAGTLHTRCRMRWHASHALPRVVAHCTHRVPRTPGHAARTTPTSPPQHAAAQQQRAGLPKAA